MFNRRNGLVAAVVILVCLLVLSALACTGPEGKQGPPGPPGPAGQQAAASTAAIVAVPASAKAEAKLTVIGAGFVPGEKVRVILEAGGVITSLGYPAPEGLIHTASASGTLRVTSVFPKGSQPGVYVVKAVGDKGSEAAVPIEVVQ